MNLKPSTTDNVELGCPACRMPRSFRVLVNETPIDGQPNFVRRQKTGLASCSFCHAVLFDEALREPEALKEPVAKA